MSARTPSLTMRLSSARKTLIPPVSTLLLSRRGDPPFQVAAIAIGLVVAPRSASGSTLARDHRSGEHDPVRHHHSVTSLSWIPSEAVSGGTRLAFDAGFTHYDEPPPAEIGDLSSLREADRFRFANVLGAWVDVDDSGRIVDFGYDGGG